MINCTLQFCVSEGIFATKPPGLGLTFSTLNFPRTLSANQLTWTVAHYLTATKQQLIYSTVYAQSPLPRDSETQGVDREVETNLLESRICVLRQLIREQMTYDFEMCATYITFTQSLKRTVSKTLRKLFYPYPYSYESFQVVPVFGVHRYQNNRTT